MKLSSTYLKLLIPAMLFCFGASAGAAESARGDPAGKHLLAKTQRVAHRTGRSAGDDRLQPPRERPHHGINSDAGIPPSGVPVITMHA